MLILGLLGLEAKKVYAQIHLKKAELAQRGLCSRQEHVADIQKKLFQCPIGDGAQNYTTYAEVEDGREIRTIRLSFGRTVAAPPIQSVNQPHSQQCYFKDGAALVALGLTNRTTFSLSEGAKIYGWVGDSVVREVGKHYQGHAMSPLALAQLADLDGSGELSMFELWSGTPKLVRAAHWSEEIARQVVDWK